MENQGILNIPVIIKSMINIPVLKKKTNEKSPSRLIFL